MVKINTWDVEAGPSKYELMVAHWYDGTSPTQREKVTFTIRSNRDTRRHRRIPFFLEGARRAPHGISGQNWILDGIIYYPGDRSDPTFQVACQITFDTVTRKGLLVVDPNEPKE